MKEKESTITATTRRRFLGHVGAAGAVAIAARVVSAETLAQGEEHSAGHEHGSSQRAREAADLRRDAAQAELQNTPPNLQHPDNGDEDLYHNKIGSYSKGLPHNDDGTVVL